MQREQLDIRTTGPEVLLRITAAHRHHATDLLLALVLTFAAGALNAGGFLLVGQYTSHMTGIVSAAADNLALGSVWLALAGFGALFSFMAGAACSAILINWGRRHRARLQYALPVAAEGLLLLAFALAGMAWSQTAWLPVAAVPLLCFVMGLQNAAITKLSGARMRTTHVTGIATDIGIELGKLAYRNTDKRLSRERDVVADRGKLRLLSLLLATFFIGGVLGAVCFGMFGYGFCALLSVLLLMMAAPQFAADRNSVGKG